MLYFASHLLLLSCLFDYHYFGRGTFSAKTVNDLLVFVCLIFCFTPTVNS